MYQELRRDSDRVRDDVIAFAQELVRIPSVSLAEGALARRVEEALVDLGYHLVQRDDYGNVVGVLLRDHTLPTVLLNAHMDTVAPSADWRRHPFAGEIEDGRLYGLGAADCKGGLAAQLYAGHVLGTSILPLRGNLVFAATVAEENGCSVGLRYLLEKTLPQLELEPGFAILGEPTALSLCNGHDGWAEVEVSVLADSGVRLAHAVDLLRRGLDGVDTGRYAPALPVLSMRAFEREAADGHHRARVRILRRLLAGESASGFVAWVRRHADAARAVAAIEVDVRPREEVQRLYTGATSRVRFRTEAWSTDPFDPKVDRAREALRAAGCIPLLRQWRLHQLGMGTAGSALVRRRIPTVGFGPGDEAEAHHGDESLDLAHLTEAVYATAVMAYSFIGAPVFPRPRDLREAA
jgi:acetylornithine deacetylase/succinyl-diaminopimelate desuccinylase-like protein